MSIARGRCPHDVITASRLMLRRKRVFIISVWVLCLLVQLFRACKSLRLWDEKKSIVPTSFLCRHQNNPKTLEAELGDGEAKVNQNEKVLITSSNASL